MKYLISILIGIVLLISGCNMSSIDNDLTSRNINGNVRSEYFYYYDAVEKFGEITKDENSKWEGRYYIYNENGFLTEEYNPQYEWNFPLKTIYTYGEKDLIIEANAYSLEEFYSKGKYFYDDSDNNTEQDWYNSSGSLTHKYFYKYDENNNRIEESGVDSDGNLAYYREYEYDDEDRIVGIKYYNSDSVFQRNTTYSFYESGKRIESKTYDSNNELDRISISEYNDNNLIIKFVVQDKDGNPTQEDQTHTYEYDNYDNWIVSISYRDETLRTYLERIIEYY